MVLMGRLALWGGTDGTRQYGDFWEYDVLLGAWRQGTYAPGGRRPLPRSEHAAVAQGMHYCVFGGCVTQQLKPGSAVSPLSMRAECRYRYGGAAEGQPLTDSAFLNDFWCLNTWSTWRMTWLEEEGVPLPIYELSDWRRDVPTLESEGAHGFFTFKDEHPPVSRLPDGVDAM
jgi:hypothetical protein